MCIPSCETLTCLCGKPSGASSSLSNLTHSRTLPPHFAHIEPSPSFYPLLFACLPLAPVPERIPPRAGFWSVPKGRPRGFCGLEWSREAVPRYILLCCPVGMYAAVVREVENLQVSRRLKKFDSNFWEIPYAPGIPPLYIQILLESNPLKSIMMPRISVLRFWMSEGLTQA